MVRELNNYLKENVTPDKKALINARKFFATVEDIMGIIGTETILAKTEEIPSSEIERLIKERDEAHRFALSSHNSKFNKRYKRSALEDIPGVGKRRAAALLAHFGSVAHIATKTPEELEKVNNIGPKMARQILKFLKGESEDEDFRKKSS